MAVRRALVVVAGALLLNGGPRAAAADGVHAGGGLGGFSALTGPARYGPAAQLEIYPGGGFGRFGVRALYLGLEDLEPAVATAGVTYTAGAARPRLHLAIHADLGLAFGETRVVAGGGVHTQLWVFGPVALGLDSLVLLFAGSGDPSLMLGTSLTIRLAN